jgi:hypothetical protein
MERRMKVKLEQGSWVEGDLMRVICAKQNGDHPYMVVEMSVAGISDVTVIFNTFDLSQIVQLARGSEIEGIQEAVRPV